MKRELLNILVCPMCKSSPLELHVFKEFEEIEEGIMTCECDRWYPIIDTIPHMLPDDLRKEGEDVTFLEKWKEKIPKKVLEGGKPLNLSTQKTKT